MIRVVESMVVMLTKELYDLDAKGEMLNLKIVLIHNSLRKLHVHNYILT